MEDLFTKGIAEFNRRHRLFYQGLIQPQPASTQLSSNNFKAACSQFGKALTKLDQYLPSFYGVNTQQLIESVCACLADAEHLRERSEGKFDESKTPLVRWKEE